ncbi:MAG: hypothetical protein ACI4SG_07235 [Oligosphaeraceae bacterium]
MFANLCNCLKDGNFWIGLLAGAVLLGILEIVILLVRKCRRGVDAIIVTGEGGTMTIKRKALKGILRNIVAQEGAVMENFWLLRQKDGRFALEISFSLTEKASLDKVQKGVQEQVPLRMKEIGIQDKISSVNLVFEKQSSSPAAEPEKKEAEKA